MRNLVILAGRLISLEQMGIRKIDGSSLLPHVCRMHFAKALGEHFLLEDLHVAFTWGVAKQNPHF